MTGGRRKEFNPKEFFSGEKARPRKSLGQNFLTDRRVIDRIVDVAEISGRDEILEIGPGVGALTLALAEKAGRVVAIEKDERVMSRLHELLDGHPNVELISGDCLKIDYANFCGGKKIKVVSNLPYSISTPVLLKLLKVRELLSSLILMLQLEVGERITASPGGKQYGSLSVLIQTYMDVKIEFRVPPSAFWPKPKVDSAVLEFVPLPRPRVPITDGSVYEKVVRAAFSSRRKMLGNSLRSILPKDAAESVLGSCGIDRRRRAETLTIEEFGLLAEDVLRRHKPDSLPAAFLSD
jgi:16S rRNA (adenine1518-N6/adenine1519-N6)-dimethyltransferase